MSHPEFSANRRFGMLFFEESYPSFLFWVSSHTKSQGLILKEQFQVEDAMLTKVAGFALPLKKSINPGLSR
jgi:hypothetical protein